ncbi:hypothetical protein [Streptomyces sp. YS-3]|uniref:hypothetical protein n=1 Tax=Streptomyces sp. YS-3 TaxID=3381352 RepID=UPI0038629A77
MSGTGSITSAAYGNGFNRWGFPDFAGDGNGFKLGGGTPAPAAAHTLRDTVAFRNAAKGITDNGNPGSITVSRCTTLACRSGAVEPSAGVCHSRLSLPLPCGA